jgi:hypothetical protein
MAYDEARSEVVLFGGNTGAPFHPLRSDTWTWDGTNWTQQRPDFHPNERYESGMAYDAGRGEVVLFGGLGNGDFFADTWTWDGTTWTRRCC